MVAGTAMSATAYVPRNANRSSNQALLFYSNRYLKILSIRGTIEYRPVLSAGPGKHGGTMNHHTIQACIDLAEAIPQDRGNYSVVRELLVELHHLAKVEEATK